MIGELVCEMISMDDGEVVTVDRLRRGTQGVMMVTGLLWCGGYAVVIAVVNPVLRLSIRSDVDWSNLEQEPKDNTSRLFAGPHQVNLVNQVTQASPGPHIPMFETDQQGEYFLTCTKGGWMLSR